MFRRTLSVMLVAAAGLLFAAGARASTYVVIAQGNHLSSQAEARLQAAGASNIRVLAPIGVAIVDSDDPAFAQRAGRIAGLQSVTEDVTLQWVNPPSPADQSVSIADAVANPPNTGDDDFFFDLQWGHDAVNAPEAWAAGARGQGVTVAVLDTGFDLTHPDLAPNIDLADSQNFIPGESLQWNGDIFSHGTHTAGTVAAADNGFGTIGIAPEARLMLVKVLSDSGSGPFSAIIQGIVWAANHDADVISMSLGADVPRNEPGVAQLLVATSRAITYAYQHGTLVVAAAGNAARDLDHDASLKSVPAELPDVLSISATAPLGWGLEPTVSLDNPASYSNYGQNGIDFAAPGGDYVGAFTGLTGPCTVDGLTRPCYVFDFVFSTGYQGWYWSVGTSMATPHAAGVAALILSAHGGHGSMTPAQLTAAMQQGADDLGKPGNDDYYGLGRLNAFGSIQ
jgi:subtilisin family serine protease